MGESGCEEEDGRPGQGSVRVYVDGYGCAFAKDTKLELFFTLCVLFIIALVLSGEKREEVYAEQPLSLPFSGKALWK